MIHVLARPSPLLCPCIIASTARAVPSAGRVACVLVGGWNMPWWQNKRRVPGRLQALDEDVEWGVAHVPWCRQR